MVKLIKGKPVLGRGGALVLLVVFGALNRMASGEQYRSKAAEEQSAQIDSAMLLLRQGDLVLRRGKDISSYMISRINADDKSYSHCGIVQIEKGRPYVYHFSLNDDGSGGMNRDPARLFFSEQYNNAGAIMRYQMTDSELAAQTELVQMMIRQKVSFDKNMNLKNNALYCSEFVSQLMNRVKADSTFIRPRTKNGYDYIPLDALYYGKTRDIWRMSFK